jgi:hypothetical protein
VASCSTVPVVEARDGRRSGTVFGFLTPGLLVVRVVRFETLVGDSGEFSVSVRPVATARITAIAATRTSSPNHVSFFFMLISFL